MLIDTLLSSAVPASGFRAGQNIGLFTNTSGYLPQFRDATDSSFRSTSANARYLCSMRTLLPRREHAPGYKTLPGLGPVRMPQPVTEPALEAAGRTSSSDDLFAFGDSKVLPREPEEGTSARRMLTLRREEESGELSELCRIEQLVVQPPTLRRSVKSTEYRNVPSKPLRGASFVERVEVTRGDRRRDDE